MRIVLCGGGSGGHIIPNIAIIHELRERYPVENDLKLLYIGTRTGMEKKMMGELRVPYRGILCGKLRRYFSLRNLLDFFKVPVGIIQALRQLILFKPDIVFCKGGYVSFPVACAGWLLGIPTILHESDVVPGLANRFSAFFATKICLSFSESKKYFSQNKKKTIVTGNPIKREMAFANYNEGLRFLDFTSDMPIVFFMGGSLGANFINQIVFRNLSNLLRKYQIVHICGEGYARTPEELITLLQKKVAPLGRVNGARFAHGRSRRFVRDGLTELSLGLEYNLLSRYRIFPFIKNELKDIYAASDVIVSRAGAMTLAEIDFFEKPALLIPLSKKASRGDQIINAQIFAKSHFCSILNEEDFMEGADSRFLLELQKLLKHEKPLVRPDYLKRQKKFQALDKIMHLFEMVVASRPR